MLLLSNLLIGQLPDAVGLLVFGIVMVSTSVALRRLVGEDAPAEKSETVFEEKV